jgi:3-oxoacyl-[acyl-carrier-protein] synthase-3
MKIRKIAFALPQGEVMSSTIAEWSGLKLDLIEEKIGIKSRRFLSENEQPIDLALSACMRLLSLPDSPRKDAIKLLAVVTQNPDYRIPHTSALLQHALGLGADTAAFDIGLGCSGYVYALSLVRSMMICEGIEDALIVTCDPYSRIMGAGDRDTIALFGDAATATWLSSEKGAVIGKMDFGTDGGGAENLIVRAGGSARPMSSLYRSKTDQTDRRDFRLHMNGRGIFNFMMERVPSSVERVLVKNNTTVKETDFFVFHQGSRFLLDQLSRRMGLEPDRVPCNIEKYGNTVSSSIPLLLGEMQDDGSLKGKQVVVSGFGVGLSWASALLQFPE